MGSEMCIRDRDATNPSPNADRLNGADYAAGDELAAGTTFKFDINVDIDASDDSVSNNDNTLDAGEAACNASAGVGEVLELKMIVDGGGTTISELQIESVVSGKEVT